MYKYFISYEVVEHNDSFLANTIFDSSFKIQNQMTLSTTEKYLKEISGDKTKHVTIINFQLL